MSPLTLKNKLIYLQPELEQMKVMAREPHQHDQAIVHLEPEEPLDVALKAFSPEREAVKVEHMEKTQEGNLVRALCL